MHIFEKANDSNHGRGINTFTQSFVVEADIPASDRSIELLAGLGHAVNHLRKLPHDVRLFGIAEIKAVRSANRSRAGTCHFARSFSDRVHRSQARVEITPSPIPVERHRQPAFRSLDANHARIPGAGRVNRIGLHHVIVLLPHPALRADVGTGEQSFELRREIAAFREVNVRRHLALDRWFPASERTLIDRRIIGQRGIRNLRDNFAVLQHAHLRIARNAANFDRIQAPLLKYAEYLVFAPFLRDQQHALLRLAQHDLVRSHARFALRNAIQFNLNAGAAARAHFARGACEAGRAHILNSDNGARLHGFKASLEQQLFKERIPHLHIGPLGLRSLTELFARHGCAVDTVASGLGAHINDRITLARGTRVKNLIAPHQPKRESIHQRIAGVAGLKFDFATKVRNAKTVPIRCDTADHALHHRMILVNFSLSRQSPCGDGRPRPSSRAQLGCRLNRPKPQRVHHRNRPAPPS